ncbi:MAG: epoxyqueuosine reductase QueH [Oscillospiraceae bacterium]|nr:epoxyqueuosine reductase QueH [Oscillospiraceae bacterium]
MTQKRNYERDMQEILHAAATPPHVLLHACCAPCSSAVLERLCSSARLTLYFYNPNILPEEEYRYRLAELRRLITEMPLPAPVELLEGPYEPERFLAFARELADAPERGERCRLCIRMRLENTTRAALALHADYFATTLTLSPHKDAPFINEAGFAIAAETGIPWLPSDFKKREGYKRSIELSRTYCLYRQDFCGCPFSKAQRHPEES